MHCTALLISLASVFPPREGWWVGNCGQSNEQKGEANLKTWKKRKREGRKKKWASKEKKKWYYKIATRKIIIVYGKELPFFFGICKNLLYGLFPLCEMWIKCDYHWKRNGFNVNIDYWGAHLYSSLQGRYHINLLCTITSGNKTLCG